MTKKVYILMLLLIPAVVFAEKVKVRVFSTANITTTKVSFEKASYSLVADNVDTIASGLSAGAFVELTPFAKEVVVAVNGKKVGNFTTVSFVSADDDAFLYISPKGCKQRSYEDNLIVTALGSKYLQLVNHVEFESYVAGVAQSEIYGKHSDIFRVQAIISRTWAMRNMEKHRADGYNFCDNVHCQAYYNRCIREDIRAAAKASLGEVLVDAEGNLIETPFHSNSGGQTANSEDVWKAEIAYLRSVKDTFSYGMKQSVWTKEVSTDKWLGYFAKNHKMNINDSAVRNELVNFVQDERKAKIMGVPLTTIRKDWNLKSTFFSVFYYGDKVVLEGKGYGHGVGLSQEGAIRMVELGIDYKDILTHYYVGSQVVRLGGEDMPDEAADVQYLAMAETTAPSTTGTGKAIEFIARANMSVDESQKRETEVVKETAVANADNKAARTSDLAARMLSTKKQLEEKSSINNNSESENDWVYEW